VLGIDGQTIGGYPKIAQVIQADLDQLGQLRPGQSVRFESVTLEDAMRRDRCAQADLRQWHLRLRLSLDAFPAEHKFA
jgi:antagonist of KipI